MRVLLITITSLVATVIGENELPAGPPGIHRVVSDGVKSVSFKVVYGDEDLAMINEVVNDVEKQSGLKSRINLNEAIKPLPAQDVKCLMSVDKYCSKEMGEMKGVLIQAIKEDCAKCSSQEREQAGKVIAAMMAHDPVAWKLFLTRSALQMKKREEPPKQEVPTFINVGPPEEVIRSPVNSYSMPGVKVRVKRYHSILATVPRFNKIR